MGESLLGQVALITGAGDGIGAATAIAFAAAGYIFGFRREPEVGWRFETMVVISENTRNPLFSAA